MAIENISDVMNKMGTLAKVAAKRFAQTSELQKNLAIQLISESLLKNTKMILEANKKDADNAKKKNIAASMLDRLLLNEERIYLMAKSLEEIIKLDDPRCPYYAGTNYSSLGNREYAIKSYKAAIRVCDCHDDDLWNEVAEKSINALSQLNQEVHYD